MFRRLFAREAAPNTTNDLTPPNVPNRLLNRGTARVRALTHASILALLSACGLDLSFDRGSVFNIPDATTTFQPDASDAGSDGDGENPNDAATDSSSIPNDSSNPNDAGQDAVSDAQSDTNPDVITPFPTCILGNPDGGASTFSVKIEGVNSAGGYMYGSPTDREYAASSHDFRLLTPGKSLPAHAVASGNGGIEITLDSRLGAKPFFTLDTSTATRLILPCAVNVESEACLSQISQAFRCEVERSLTSGCPSTLGFTPLGNKTTHKLSGAGQHILVSAITCP